MKQGEIWLVKFINSVGHEFKKERPALIIESNSQINKASVITIIPLTSKLTNRISDDILISKNKNNNLYWDSLLKVHHIQSFDKTRFIKEIGIADAKTNIQVKSFLKKRFDI